jgi:hypothetical protein
MSDGMHLHQSTGSTPTTAGAMDRHHATDPTDSIPSRASTIAGASISQSWPVGLRYAVRYVESMLQLGATVVHPLCRPIRQRPRAQVLGLDGRAEPLSGGDGRRGAVSRKVKKWVWFSTGEGHQEEEQEEECKRSDDSEAIDVGGGVEQVDRPVELRWSEVVCI